MQDTIARLVAQVQTLQVNSQSTVGKNPATATGTRPPRTRYVTMPAYSLVCLQARMADLNLAQDSSDDEDIDEELSPKRGKGQISGRARTTDDTIVSEVNCSHYHVYKWGDGRPAKYEELSVQEFVGVYLACLLQGKESTATQQR